MYYNWGAALGAGSKIAQGDVPGAALAAGAGFIPYGWAVGFLPAAVGLAQWAIGGGGGPPEHIGYPMLANVPLSITGQDDNYVYFSMNVGELAGTGRPDGYYLTQFRVDKRTGAVEYLQDSEGLAHAGHEQPETGQEVQASYGYGAKAQWVPLSNTLKHGDGPTYLIDPAAFSVHLYWDIFKPAGLEGLWKAEVPPQQVTPSMYQWQPGLESESIDPAIAQGVTQAFAAGTVPAVLPYYVKIGNHGEVQGAYGAVPAWQQQGASEAQGVIDMAEQQQVPSAQDWYSVAGDYAKQATSYKPGTYIGAAFNYIAKLLAEGDLETQQAAWLMDVLRQLEGLAQPVAPLAVGPFSVVPKGRMAMQQAQIAALMPLVNQLADWEKQIQARNLQRQGYGVESTTQLGVAGEQALQNYARMNLDLAALAARLGMSQQELMYKYWQGQLDAETKKQVAQIVGQYEVKAKEEGQPPTWAYALQGAPGLVSLAGLAGSGLKGFLDWLGGTSGAASGSSSGSTGGWLYDAGSEWLLG